MPDLEVRRSQILHILKFGDLRSGSIHAPSAAVRISSSAPELLNPTAEQCSAHDGEGPICTGPAQTATFPRPAQVH